MNPGYATISYNEEKVLVLKEERTENGGYETRARRLSHAMSGRVRLRWPCAMPQSVNALGCLTSPLSSCAIDSSRVGSRLLLVLSLVC